MPKPDFASHAAAIEAAQGYAANPYIWNPPSPEQVAHLLQLSGIVVEAPAVPIVKTYTAFCQQIDGSGTIWIDKVQAETVADAVAAAQRDCAEAWEYEPEKIHCLGIAAGDVGILHWEDIGDD